MRRNLQPRRYIYIFICFRPKTRNNASHITTTDGDFDDDEDDEDDDDDSCSDDDDNNNNNVDDDDNNIIVRSRRGRRRSSYSHLPLYTYTQIYYAVIFFLFFFFHSRQTHAQNRVSVRHQYPPRHVYIIYARLRVVFVFYTAHTHADTYIFVVVCEWPTDYRRRRRREMMAIGRDIRTRTSVTFTVKVIHRGYLPPRVRGRAAAAAAAASTSSQRSDVPHYIIIVRLYTIYHNITIVVITIIYV